MIGDRSNFKSSNISRAFGIGFPKALFFSKDHSFSRRKIAERMVLLVCTLHRPREQDVMKHLIRRIPLLCCFGIWLLGSSVAFAANGSALVSLEAHGNFHSRGNRGDHHRR